jgi:hypothetical protein
MTDNKVLARMALAMFDEGVRIAWQSAIPMVATAWRVRSWLAAQAR